MTSKDTADIRIVIGVEGMTCGHCVMSVTEELEAVEGIRGVDVALVPGAVSTVTVTSANELDPEQLAAAINEAGYVIAKAPS